MNEMRTNADSAALRSAERASEPSRRAAPTDFAARPRLLGILHDIRGGSPLHVGLVTLPLSALTAAKVLSLLELAAARRQARRRRAANFALAVGLASGIPAALTGIADWRFTDGEARKLGVVPIVATAAAVGLYGASALAKARGRRVLGEVLLGLGLGCVLLTSWVGRRLVFRYGVGVDERALQEGDAIAGGLRVREPSA